MEKFFKKVLIIFIIFMNLLAFIAEVFFTLHGIKGDWLIFVPVISLVLLYFMFIFED